MTAVFRCESGLAIHFLLVFFLGHKTFHVWWDPFRGEICSIFEEKNFNFFYCLSNSPLKYLTSRLKLFINYPKLIYFCYIHEYFGLSHSLSRIASDHYVKQDVFDWIPAFLDRWNLEFKSVKWCHLQKSNGKACISYL